MSKEELVNKLYNMLVRECHGVCVFNEKYLIVDGVTYQFIKRKTGWEAKAF